MNSFVFFLSLSQEFNRFNDIVKQILLEPSNVEFPLIQTNSDQVKKGLVDAARQHRSTLVEKLVNNYRKECLRLVDLTEFFCVTNPFSS